MDMVEDDEKQDDDRPILSKVTHSNTTLNKASSSIHQEKSRLLLSKQQSNQTSTTINAASTATTDLKAMNTNANADSFSDILETQIKASPKRFDKKEVALNVEEDEERNHSSSSSYDDSPSFNLSRTISHDHSQFIISRKNQLKRYKSTAELPNPLHNNNHEDLLRNSHSISANEVQIQIKKSSPSSLRTSPLRSPPHQISSSKDQTIDTTQQSTPTKSRKIQSKSKTIKETTFTSPKNLTKQNSKKLKTQRTENNNNTNKEEEFVLKL
jgi:hypothetical protein